MLVSHACHPPRRMRRIFRAPRMPPTPRANVSTNFSKFSRCAGRETHRKSNSGRRNLFSVKFPASYDPWRPKKHRKTETKKIEKIANFERPFTPRGWLRLAWNFAKTRFRWFPTFHLSTLKTMKFSDFWSRTHEWRPGGRTGGPGRPPMAPEACAGVGVGVQKPQIDEVFGPPWREDYRREDYRREVN